MNGKLQSVDIGLSSRMNSESLLKNKIRRKESELNALQTLYSVIPWESLSDEDEEKLCLYFDRVC